MKKNNKENNYTINLPVGMLDSIIRENNVQMSFDEMADVFTSSIAHIFEIDKAPEGDITYKIVKKDKSYEVIILRRWIIVDKIEHPDLEITLSDKKISKLNFKIGDIFEEPQEAISILERGNISKVRAVLRQKIISTRNSQIYTIMQPYENKIINGVIESVQGNNLVRVKVLDQFYGYYPYENQIRNEILDEGKTLEFYVEKVDDNAYKNFPLILSRSSEDFLKEIMSQEIPEVDEGSVIIKEVKRLSGIRAKVGVISKDPMIDPIGSCVGNAGSRINSVSQRINGEKIDLFVWSDDTETLIRNAFNPINVLKIIKTDDIKTPVYKIIVSTDDILKAIGKRGSNCILVSKLINAPVKILSVVDAINEGYDVKYIDDEKEPVTKKKIIDTTENKGTQISSDTYYNFVGSEDDENIDKDVIIHDDKNIKTNGEGLKKAKTINKKTYKPTVRKDTIDDILLNKSKDKKGISLDDIYDKSDNEVKKKSKKPFWKKETVKEEKQDILSKIIVEDNVDDYDSNNEVTNSDYYVDEDDDDDYM